ncbi:MAG: hypothetical protein ACLP7P_20190 [Rhodomicrobium sp.]
MDSGHRRRPAGYRRPIRADFGGEEGTFVGSVPAELPEKWQHRLVEDALRLAPALQLLGNFGRCSLGTLLVGQTLDSAVLHWIECNGRWGGVSIPMTIVNRPPRPFADALQALDGILFGPGRNERGIIQYPAE